MALDGFKLYYEELPFEKFQGGERVKVISKGLINFRVR